MNQPAANPPAALSDRREKLVVWLLCLGAAIHVFVFSAAFPFFNPIDEEFHFDLMVKYSQGHFPRGLEHFSEESQPYVVYYGTLEYAFPADKCPPAPWSLPTETAAPFLQANAAAIQKEINHESSQPPLYYLMTGMWWRLGRMLKLNDGFLLYSIRFLNMFFISAAVWVGYLAARTLFPDRPLICLGVPAFVAFIPQSVFYSVQNDVPSPIFFGVAFICLARWLRGDSLTVGLASILGLALTGTLLTKMSNLPVLAVATVAVMVQSWRLARANALRPALPAIAVLILCGGVPAFGLLLWNKHAHGDFLGSAAKIHYLTWTVKPFSEWWSHPIFTPHGLWTFVSGVIATLWQGEFFWHGHPLASPAINTIYTILTLSLVGLAVAGLLSRSEDTGKFPRRALWLAFGCITASVVFLGYLSIIYDFHDCFYPSRAHPYFTSGRLLLGALIPFLLLFMYGLDRALSWIKIQWIRPAVLPALILFMLVTEIATNWPVFFSQYNWFHM